MAKRKAKSRPNGPSQAISVRTVDAMGIFYTQEVYFGTEKRNCFSSIDDALERWDGFFRDHLIGEALPPAITEEESLRLSSLLIEMCGECYSTIDDCLRDPVTFQTHPAIKTDSSRAKKLKDYLEYLIDGNPFTRLDPPSWLVELRSSLSKENLTRLIDCLMIDDYILTLIQFVTTEQRPTQKTWLKAIGLAIRIGQQVERLRLRKIEPIAVGGIKVKAAADIGRKTQQRQRREKWAIWQAMVDEIRFGKGGDWEAYLSKRKKPKQNHSQAMKFAAKELGVSVNTLKEHVVNRTPTKRKRK